ncbi:hypothetical protein LTR37_007424 [Vermiconidia calcicola]|uniref:Uncharacterized protein n=1 Tax=Vermiconidia calcicola TaxID=1690605 RepID=A0ACC3NEW5_9PEZI|nr:hypothetical protein LTR37_007424 [Vermiconidia calcicola]
MKVWDPEHKKVVRTTSLRTDDGTGLDDAQDEDSIRDRTPRPDINEEDAELLEQMADDSSNDDQDENSSEESDIDDDGQSIFIPQDDAEEP